MTIVFSQPSGVFNPKTVDYVNHCLKICSKKSSVSIWVFNWFHFRAVCCCNVNHAVYLISLPDHCSRNNWLNVRLIGPKSSVSAKWCHFQLLKKAWRLLEWDYPGFSIIYFNGRAYDAKFFWRQITKSFQAKLRSSTQRFQIEWTFFRSSEFFVNLVIFAEKPVAVLAIGYAV